MRVIIDPGHGGDDPGAVAPCLTEAHLNLQFALVLRKALESEGFTDVVLTRTTDEFVPLARRAQWGCDPRDVFISIHHNSAVNVNAVGLEVLTSIGNTRADELAQHILTALRPTERLRVDESDGDLDKEQRVYVLERTVCPAVLIELGFISNEKDRARCCNSDLRITRATIIAEAIARWSRSSSPLS